MYMFWIPFAFVYVCCYTKDKNLDYNAAFGVISRD